MSNNTTSFTMSFLATESATVAPTFYFTHNILFFDLVYLFAG